jgi:hypothetical protein
MRQRYRPALFVRFLLTLILVAPVALVDIAIAESVQATASPRTIQYYPYPPPSPSPQAYPPGWYRPAVACCTQAIRCPLAFAAAPGSPCYCATPYGPIQGVSCG